MAYPTFNTVEEYEEYLNGIEIKRSIKKIILHVLWRKPKNVFWGEDSLIGLEKYYKDKGRGKGFHLCIAQGKIFEFLSLNEPVDQSGKDDINLESIAIEIDGVIGGRKPSKQDWILYLETIDLLMKKFNLEPNQIYCHYRFDPDTPCPGFDEEYLLKEINRYVR